jgi:hypothetical protein
MSPRIHTLAGLAAGAWWLAAVAQTPDEAWSLSGFRAETVPAIWAYDGGRFERRAPRESDAFIEVRARLTVRSGVPLDPILLADIRIRPASGGALQSAHAVGASIAMCRYLPPEPSPGAGDKMALVPAGHIAVFRESVSAPVQLKFEASAADLCLAFPRIGDTAQGLTMEFAGRTFAVSVAQAPIPGARAPDAATVSRPASIDSRTLLIAAGSAGLLALLALAGFAFWRWRRRAAPIAAEAPVPPGEGAPEGPPRVSEVHCRTAFRVVEKDAGPGKAKLDEALLMLQDERSAQADAAVAEAMRIGLSPTHQCGAWSLRGQITVELGDLGRAIDFFLKALAAAELTAEGAFPAASYLAVIYRALGLRADAKSMERVAVAANTQRVDLHPARIKRIRKLARAYRKAFRRGRFRRLLARMTGAPPAAGADA